MQMSLGARSQMLLTNAMPQSALLGILKGRIVVPFCLTMWALFLYSNKRHSFASSKPGNAYRAVQPPLCRSICELSRRLVKT